MIPWTFTTLSDLYVGRDACSLVRASPPVYMTIIVNESISTDANIPFSASFGTEVLCRCTFTPKYVLLLIRPGFGCSCCLMCVSRLMSCVAASWVSEEVDGVG